MQYFQMIKQKVYYLLPEILDQLSNLNIGFAPATFDGNLFQLIVRLNPDFNSCSSFALSSVDNVTAGEKKFCISYCKCCCLIFSRIRSNNTINIPM